MRKMLTAAVLALGLGCDDGGDDPLVGLWATNVGGCAVAMEFRGDQTYEADVICGSGLSVQIEAVVGTYSTDGGRLTTVAKMSSCPSGKAATGTTAYRVDGDQLTMSGSSGVVILKRFEREPSAAGVVATYGCWDNGTFTPSPMRAL